MTIDAHHHFWRYDPEEFDWIDEEMSAIRRDFLPADLKREIDGGGIDQVISVQARQAVDETRGLLDLAQQNDFIAAVVGWLPLASSRIAENLAEFANNRKLRGLRHVLQGETDAYMLRRDFNAGVRALARHGLTYDILIFERQLPQTIEFVDRHPEQLFVLDHIAKPRIRENVISPWRENIRELARRPHVFCKTSGMVTEADYQAWSTEQLRPYFDIVLEAFGPKRLMFGSDWPVCLVACDYARWVRTVRSFVATLSPAEQADIMGETARRAYRID